LARLLKGYRREGEKENHKDKRNLGKELSKRDYTGEKKK